ncbi:MAG: right-handed parallel beta-helix repeat-containing protein [Methylomonas sp.]
MKIYTLKRNFVALIAIAAALSVPEFGAASTRNVSRAATMGTNSNATSGITSYCAPSPASSYVVNVMNEGATGNGKTDDTAAIQKAINLVAGTGGTVLIPNGTYLIDTAKSLKLAGDMTLALSIGAELVAIANNLTNYNVILIDGVANVSVVGGSLQGDRATHLGATGEWGMGIMVLNSQNVYLDTVNSANMWGDGFYIGDSSVNVTVCNVNSDNNRRQGLTVTSANGVLIENSTFQNTNGAYPSAGIDIEPNNGEVVNNVRILNSKFAGNWGSGIQSSYNSGSNPSTTNTTGLTISGNSITNNGVVGAYSAAIYLTRQTNAVITNNLVKNNVQDGVVLTYYTVGTLVSGNTVAGSGYGNTVDKHIGNGVLMYYDSTNNTILNNTVTGNIVNIFDLVGGNTITGNTVNSQ